MRATAAFAVCALLNGCATSARPVDQPVAASTPLPRVTSSLRTLAPIAFRRAIPGQPHALSETLLAFGFDLNGIDDLFDTKTGRVSSPRLPTGYPPRFYRQCESYPAYGDAVQVGDRVVIGVGPKDGCALSRTYSIPADLGAGKFVRIAANDGYVSSVNGRGVWLTHSGLRGIQTVTERDPDTGALLRSPLRIDQQQRVVATVRGGLLAVRTDEWPRTTIDVISSATGHVTRVITRRGDSLLAAHGDLVAWQGPAGCDPCQVHLTDLSTGTTQSVRWSAPQRYLCDSGALSPDTRWLAIQYGCPRPDYQGRSPIVLVDTATGEGRIVPGSAQQQDGSVVWTADSRWLIWEGDAHGLRLLAYHPRAWRLYAFPVPRKITSELLGAFSV